MNKPFPDQRIGRQKAVWSCGRSLWWNKCKWVCVNVFIFKYSPRSLACIWFWCVECEGSKENTLFSIFFGFQFFRLQKISSARGCTGTDGFCCLFVFMCLRPEQEWFYINRKRELVENSANNGKLPFTVAMQQAFCNNKSIRLSPFMLLPMFAGFLAEGMFLKRKEERLYDFFCLLCNFGKVLCVAFVTLNLWGFEE